MRPIFLFVGDTVRNPARSGIQTVVRSLADAFSRMGANVRLILWNARLSTVRPVPPDLSLSPEADVLRDRSERWPRALWSQPGAWLPWLVSGLRGRLLPIDRHPLYRVAPKGTWILMPELMYKGRGRLLTAFAHRHGWRIAVILYDTIPEDHPEFVPAALPAQHAAYLRAFSEADLILPISEASAEGWRRFCQREKLTTPPIQVCTLACDLTGVTRVTSLGRQHSSTSDAIRMLCVSTLEPRKNHQTLIAAYELARAARPDVLLELDLIGAAYPGMDDLETSVRAASARLPGLRWHGQVDYETLRAHYAACDFTVYPSLVEGFGLPVIESLWFGRPCVCASFGVMAENAVGGGCLTVDVRDSQVLADAMLRLATDAGLRLRLAAEATHRPLKTWSDYAREIIDCLASR